MVSPGQPVISPNSDFGAISNSPDYALFEEFNPMGNSLPARGGVVGKNSI
jgi:hypothetical protein